MFGYLKEISSFSKWQTQQYRLVFLFALLLLSFIGSGCNLTSAKERYENLEFGISLEKPTNWQLEFYERNGSIVLEAEEGIWINSSARIEIYGYACNPISPAVENKDIEDTLEEDIRRIGTLYDLDTVVVLQEPTLIENEEYEIGTAVIQIPIEALAEDPARNQVGYPGTDIFQTIDILDIRDRNHNNIMVYIYKGLSQELNAEAQDIVDSIEIICSSQS